MGTGSIMRTEEEYLKCHAERKAEVLKILKDLPDIIEKVEDYIAQAHTGSLKVSEDTANDTLSTLALSGATNKLNAYTGLMDLYVLALDILRNGRADSLEAVALAYQISRVEEKVDEVMREVQRKKEMLDFFKDSLRKHR